MKFLNNLMVTLHFKKRTYFIVPFIYLTKDGFIDKYNITDKVQWLKKLSIDAYSEKEANKIAFEKLNKQYPQYSGHIWLL